MLCLSIINVNITPFLARLFLFVCLRTGHGSDLFNINSTTAVITTRFNTSLDRETNDTYSLTVRATDSGNKTSTVPLVVKVTDVNDELPRFSQQVYYANVSEDAVRGTTVRRVTATDLDLLVLNKEITYTSTGADAKFYINRATGWSMEHFCPENLRIFIHIATCLTVLLLNKK